MEYYAGSRELVNGDAIDYPLLIDIYGAYRRVPNAGIGYDRLKDWLRAGKEAGTFFDRVEKNIGPDPILQYFYKGIQLNAYDGKNINKYAPGKLNPGLSDAFKLDLLRWDIAKGTMTVAIMNSMTINRYNYNLGRLDQIDSAKTKISNPYPTQYDAKRFEEMSNALRDDFGDKIWQSAKILGTPLLDEQPFKSSYDVQKHLNKNTPTNSSTLNDRVTVGNALGIDFNGKIGNRLVDMMVELIPSPNQLLPMDVMGYNTNSIRNLTAGGLLKELGSKYGGQYYSTATKVTKIASLAFGKEIYSFKKSFGLNNKLVGSLLPSVDIGSLINRISKNGWEFHRFEQTTPYDAGDWINYSLHKQYRPKLANFDQDQGEITQNSTSLLGFAKDYFDFNIENKEIGGLYIMFQSSIGKSTTSGASEGGFLDSLKAGVPDSTSESKIKIKQHTIYNPFFDNSTGDTLSGTVPNKKYLDKLKRMGLLRFHIFDDLMMEQYAPLYKFNVMMDGTDETSTAAAVVGTYPKGIDPGAINRDDKRKVLKNIYKSFLHSQKVPTQFNTKNRKENNLDPFNKKIDGTEIPIHSNIESNKLSSQRNSAQKSYNVIPYKNIPNDIYDVDVKVTTPNARYTTAGINGSQPIPIIDFRALTATQSRFSTNPEIANYKEANLNARYGLGDQGRPGSDRSNPHISNVYYVKSGVLAGASRSDIDSKKASIRGLTYTNLPYQKNGKEFRGDRINIIDYKRVNSAINKRLVYELFKPGDSEINADNKHGEFIPGKEDLIDFYFTSLILKGHGFCPAEVIVFRAILDNITDNMNPSWNAQKYIGRADPVYVYNSFERSISFGFTIAITSRDELKATWRKINYLASWCAPEYTTSGMMRGPLLRLNIGHLYRKLPGFFESFSISIDNKETPWEIAKGLYDTDKSKPDNSPGVLQLPKIINISVGFKVIGNYRPQKNGIMFGLYDDTNIAANHDKVETGMLPVGNDTGRVNYFEMFDRYNPADRSEHDSELSQLNSPDNVFPAAFEITNGTIVGGDKQLLQQAASSNPDGGSLLNDPDTSGLSPKASISGNNTNPINQSNIQ